MLQINWYVTGVALIALFICWLVKGRDEKSTRTLETTPPCDPIQMGYMLDGMISERAIIAAVLYWRNKGHLKIDGNNIHIISIPEGGYEEKLFRALFKNNKTVEVGALSAGDTFGVDKEIGNMLGESFYAGAIPFKSIENYIYAAAWLIIGYKGGALLLILFLLLNWVSVVMLKRQIAEIRSSEKFVFTNQTLGALLITVIAWIIGPMALNIIMPGTILFLAGTFLLAIMDKRNNSNLYGRIKGYGDYLKTTEYEKFVTLRKTDPQYGNDILPYLVLFGMGTPETKAYVEAVSKTDQEASERTRKTYINSVDLAKLKKEPFEMKIQKIGQFGIVVINGRIESGMLVWDAERRGHNSLPSLLSDIHILVPLADGTKKEIKVRQIAVEEDKESTVNMAVKGDHISFAIRGLNSHDIQKDGRVTIVNNG